MYCPTISFSNEFTKDIKYLDHTLSNIGCFIEPIEFSTDPSRYCYKMPNAIVQYTYSVPTITSLNYSYL